MREVHGRARLPIRRLRKAASSALRATVRRVAGEDEWLDAEAAARYINLPVRSIYRLVHDGRLKAVRFPVQFRRHELDACSDGADQPGEVAHLNAFPGGASRVAEPPLTKQGRPDRRYGTEQSPGACGGLPRWVRSGPPCQA